MSLSEPLFDSANRILGATKTADGWARGWFAQEHYWLLWTINWDCPGLDQADPTRYRSICYFNTSYHTYFPFCGPAPSGPRKSLVGTDCLSSWPGITRPFKSFQTTYGLPSPVLSFFVKPDSIEARYIRYVQVFLLKSILMVPAPTETISEQIGSGFEAIDSNIFPTCLILK